MGYSCEKSAGDMLGVIYRMFATKGGGSNCLTIKGKDYFYERGRENGDGAVTGTLMEMLPEDKCRKAGTFRINPGGEIARFPGITKAEKREALDTLRDMEARNPDLLSRWAMGRI